MAVCCVVTGATRELRHSARASTRLGSLRKLVMHASEYKSSGCFHMAHAFTQRSPACMHPFCFMRLHLHAIHACTQQLSMHVVILIRTARFCVVFLRRAKVAVHVAEKGRMRVQQVKDNRTEPTSISHMTDDEKTKTRPMWRY